MDNENPCYACISRGEISEVEAIMRKLERENRELREEIRNI